MDEISIKKEPRAKEFLEQNDEDTSVTSWRMFRILAELVSGFELLRKHSFAATIYGSSRAANDSHESLEAEKLAQFLAAEGLTVITGGGGGIMRAANKGAYESGGKSIGLNIKLPEEQHLNAFVTDSLLFHFFFTRKTALAFASDVYIFFPGGFGTLDEFFEIITLVQTHKIRPIPVLVVGREYWVPLFEWMRAQALEKNYVNPQDFDIIRIVDSAEEARDVIRSLVKH